MKFVCIYGTVGLEFLKPWAGKALLDFCKHPVMLKQGQTQDFRKGGHMPSPKGLTLLSQQFKAFFVLFRGHFNVFIFS